MAFCCPPDSWPSLSTDYKAKHSSIKIGTMDTYYVPSAKESKAGIIVIIDIFGQDSGRTKAIADQFGEDGYHVAVPDLFYGEPYPEDEKSMSEIGTRLPSWAEKFPAEKLSKDVKATVEYMKSKGVEKIGLIGFCWGVWAEMKFLQDSELAKNLNAVVGFHPSVQLEGWVWKRDNAALGNIVSETPVFFLTAAGDLDLTKEGGQIFTAVQKKAPKSKTKEYPEMKHGWVNRGDVKDPAVKRDVEDALRLGSDFLKQFLKN